MTNIFQAPILVNFLYPMLLVFFIVFAILEKTKILGAEDKKQLNALVALVVSLIFVAAVFPVILVENIILYLSVALVTIFVGLMLWGFISGKGDFTVTEDKTIKIHRIFAFLIIGSLICAILWASGLGGAFISSLDKLLSYLFKSSWSSSFWTNFLFIAIIFIVVATVTDFHLFKKFNPWIILKK